MQYVPYRVQYRADIDFSKWAIAAPNDNTGLGRMAQDARAVLGIGHQLVIPSRRLSTKPLRPGDLLLTPRTLGAEIIDFLEPLEGLIVLERPDWTPTLLPKAKRLGLRIIGVPLWEWFDPSEPLWHHCDLFVCPNRQCFEVVRAAEFENSIVLPWPVDLARFPHRPVSGPAKVFVHNAGLLDADDRSGTRDTIEAFKRVPLPGVRLIVRMQQPASLPSLDKRVQICVANLPDPSALWAEGDAAIQPSKIEGLGLMILEPICCGLPVMTLNAAPMNEYGTGLLVRTRAFPGQPASPWGAAARLHAPQPVDLARKIQFCAEHDLGEVSKHQRLWAEEMFDPARLRGLWRHALSSVSPSVAEPDIPVCSAA